MKKVATGLAASLTLQCIFCSAQPCPPNSLQQYMITAHQTDINIPVEPQKHYVFINTACTPRNILLVYLVGTAANPSGTLYFPQMAANNGFHVVSLKYPNSLSAQVPCRDSPDADCYEDFRKEILEGIDYSSAVSVDPANSVYNRLLKLLIYLDGLYPQQGWDQYYSGANLLWDRIIVAGHSQGGGHAAMIAKDHDVKRVLMFASPNDYSDFFNAPALWTSKPHVTPGYVYYSFGNVTDEIVDYTEQYQQWDALGLDDFGDTVSVENNTVPYFYSHQLYTSYDPPGSTGNHNSVIVDTWTPLQGDGTPEFQPVWEYMLGAGDSRPSEIKSENFPLDDNTFTYALRSDDFQQTGNKCQPYEIVVFDALGRFVTRSIIADAKFDFPSSFRLPSGIYYYTILDESGNQLETSKFISMKE